MASQALILVLACLSMSYGLENLNLIYQWKLVDFEYPTPEARQQALSSGEFVPENNLILGLEVFGDRLFITVPRWKTGVPASLTYIDLKDTSESPKLRPYPNWAAHKLPETDDGEPPEIVCPFRVRADRCGRLWVLDTGIADIFGKPHTYTPAQMLIYDLRTDTLLRRFPIPKDQVTKDSFLANIAVEDEDCSDAYGYFGDLGDPAIIVYSFAMNASWRIKHHYFHFNPLFAEFNVAGSQFIWTDGVFGMGLTPPGPDGFSTLYFHPMTGTNEFSVSTKYLRNSTLAKDNFHMFKLVGSRGPNGQSGVAFLDKKSGVLFYALINQDTIACWRTTSGTYTLENQGRIHENNVTMIFPNDIKVDPNNNVWVLSDRLPIFLYSKLNESDFNFRVFMAPLQDAIKNTVCDVNSPAASLDNKIQPAGPTLGPQQIADVFSNFQTPTQVPITVNRPTQDKIRPPVHAVAVAEIPDTINSLKQPAPRPQFPGNPDLAFMFQQPGVNPLNIFHSPTKVPIEGSQNGDGKKGFELSVSIPVNLYITVDNP